MKPSLLHKIEMRGLQIFRPAIPPASTISNGAEASESWKSYMNGTALSLYGVLRRASGAPGSEPSKVAIASRSAIEALDAHVRLGEEDDSPDGPETSRKVEAALLALRNEPIRSTADYLEKCNVLRAYLAQLPAWDASVHAFTIALPLEIADFLERRGG